MNTTPATTHLHHSRAPVRHRRSICVFLCALCLCGVFSSCAPIRLAPPVRVEKMSMAPLQDVTVKTLTFWVSDQLDAEVLRQADLFADRVEQISGGMLLVSVHATPPDFPDIAQGKCDLALFRNIQLAQERPAFSTFSMPFLFGSASHLSNSLNSDEMLNRLRGYLGTSGVVPLGAVYYGSTTLVSDRGAVQVPTDFSDRIIALRTNNTDKLTAFEALGARVLPYSQDSLVALLGMEVEILPEDLTKPSDVVTIDTVETTLSQLSELPVTDVPYYVMTPGHSATALWLVANSTAWNGLSAWERAVLEEAKAGMFAEIDRFYIARETQIITDLAANKQTELFRLEHEIIADTLYASSDRYRLPSYFDYKLYSMVTSYG